MIDLPEMVVLPLKVDEHGVIYITGTRIPLDSLIVRYQQGDTPESIHQGFPTIPLTDIYSVIAYYLAHRDDVDTYLKQREQDAERIRQEWETRNPPPSKAELMSRLENRKREDNEA